MTNYERLQLSDKIVHVLEQAGLNMDLEKVQSFVDEIVDEQNKVKNVTERDAIKELVYWFENEADMDDLAREYSRMNPKGCFRIVRTYDKSGAPSDVFRNGKRVD